MKNSFILKFFTALVVFIVAFTNVNATDFYVSNTGSNATGNGSIGNPWQTIAFAIANATVLNGDVINVAAGTYTENLVVTKNLTFKGSNAGTSAGRTPGARVLESVLNGRFQLNTPETIFTLDGFTVNVPSTNAANSNARIINFNTATSGTFNIINNILDGGAYSQSVGVYCSPGSLLNVTWNISNNSFNNFNQQSINLANVSGMGNISGNIFTLNPTSNFITLGSTITNGQVITDNKFTGSSTQNALVLNNPGNTISKNLFESVVSTVNSAIIIGAAGSGHIISQNTFNNTSLGIQAASGNNSVFENFFTTGNNAFRLIAPGGASNNLYSNSLLSTSAVVVQGLANFVINASCNWWGSASPAVSKVTSLATVTMAPWLTAGVDTDGGIPGFQTTEVCMAPCNLQIQTTPTPETVCANGAASVTVISGGTGTYTYSWNTTPVQTTSSISGLVAGSYTATVKDLNGCSATSVAVVANNLTGPVRNITSGINYCKIQAAVTAASPDDIIEVDAGVYSEGIITINKPLTLKGANAGISIGSTPGVRVAESVLNGEFKTSNVNGTLTIDGFTINATVNGGNGLNCNLGGSGDIYVLNNYMDGRTFSNTRGIYTGANVTWHVIGNTITNYKNYGILLDATLPAPTPGLGTFKGNIISKNASGGMIIQGSVTTPQLITENYFDSCGIVVSNGANGHTFSKNTFVGPRTAIQCISVSGTSSSNNNYSENNFNNAGNAIQILGLSTGNTVFHNSFTHTANFLVSASTSGSTVDATCNWWNSTSPSSSKVCCSGVTMLPWLIDGTDSDPLTSGFQTASACYAPCNLQLSITTTPTTICSNGTASVSVVSGGSGSYTYSWNSTPVQTTATATGLNPGTYTVSVSDLNGCSALATVTVANNLTTGPVQNINTGIYYCTIQSAISDPLTLNGHTITAAAGTYPENIISGKNVILVGANAGISAGKYPGVRGAESVIEGSIQVGGIGLPVPTGFTLDGFTIKATATSVLGSTANRKLFYSYSVASGAVYLVKNNIIDGNYQGKNLAGCGSGINCAGTTGIFGGNDASWTVSNNKISNHYYWGILVDGTNTNGIYSGNLITDNIGGNPGYAGGGIIMQGSLAVGEIITDNEFIHNGGSIILGSGGHTISQNTFSNGSGIYAVSDNNSVSENFFDNTTTYAFWLDAAKTGNVLYHNSILGGSPTTVYGSAGGIVTATCNWWGSTAPAVVSTKVNSYVTYLPWLISGIDEDGGTPGFQTTAACNVPCNLQLSTSTTTETLCGNGTASVSVVSGGSGSYTYLWNTVPAQTTATATGLHAGTYSVTVNDLNGCTASVSNIIVSVNLITGLVNNLNTGKHYCTIQSAINDPLTLSGHTLQVAAGTFVENVNTLGKSLTFLGANAGISSGSNPGVRGPESIIVGQINNTIGVSDFSIDGFTLDLGVNASFITQPSNSVLNSYTITNNIFTNTGAYTNCTALNLQSAVVLSTLTVTGNSFSGFVYSGAGDAIFIQQNAAVGTGTISGNNFYNNRRSGIKLGSLNLNTTPGMVISDNLFDMYLTTSYASAGIIMYNSGNTITNNQFTGAGNGINSQGDNNNTTGNIFLNDGYAYATNADAYYMHYNALHFNYFGGGTRLGYSIAGYSYSYILDATCNWWGSTDPAVNATKINYPGTVTAIPWLRSGTDTDPGTPGFQTTEVCSAPCDLVLTATPTQPSCPGETGNVSLSVSGGSGTYTLDGTDTTDLAAGTYNYSVLDLNGCTATASVTILEGVDITPPVASCQDVTVQLDNSGNGSTTTAAVNNGSSDGCSIPTLALSQYNFSCAQVGSNTVVLTVTDNSDNSSTCSATVMVKDEVAPVAICKDITVQLSATGSAVITAASINNVSSDACGLKPLTINKSTFGCADTGSNAVILTVTDVNNNVSTCTSTVTVEDNVAPEALCRNVTVHLDATGYGNVSPFDVNNSSSDVCGILPQCAPAGPMVSCLSGFMLDKRNFDCSDIGANTVVLTVTDNHYNSSTCSAVATVVDDVAPNAVCQNVTVQLDATGNGSTTAAAVNNGSSDACGIASLTLNKTTFNCSDVGPKTVNLTVKDVNNNLSNCSATVTVQDNVAPVAICKNITIALSVSGSASITASQVNNGSSDACGIASTTVTPSSFNCTNTGMNTVILKVTDANNNTSTCSSVVTVTGGALYNYVMLASDKIHLHHSNVQSGGIGITTTTGEAEIEEYTTVTASGTFVQAVNIDVNSGGVATTQINTVASAPLPSFETNPYSSNNNIHVAGGQTLTLTDTIYNEIKIDKYGTVIFTQPVVNIKKIDAKEFSVIKFTQCTKVRMKEDLKLKRNSLFNPDGLGVTVFTQKGADIQEGSKVFATLYAKDQNIKVKGKSTNRTQMTGLFIAKTIEKGEYTDWNANTQCGKCTVGPISLFARISATTDVSCDGEMNGSATVIATGGTGPYTYSWNTSPVQTTPTATNLAPGTYIVTVTDALGAVSTVSTDIIVFTYTILASDEVNIGKFDTVFTGSVGVTKNIGKVTIESSSVLDDDAFVIAPVINFPGGGTASDTIYGVANPVLSAFEGNITYSSNSDLNIANGTTYIMAATDTLRHHITIGDNATLVVSASVLNLTDKLELKKNSTLKFTQACTKVRVKGDLVTGDNPTINAEGKQVAFHVNGNVTINKGASVTGTIYAPNGTIQTQNATAQIPSVMTGKFIGKKVFGGDYTNWYESTACPCSSGSGSLNYRLNNQEIPVIEKQSVKELKVNAYPNPFKNTVTISFTLPERSENVKLTVYNTEGKDVSQLYNNSAEANTEYQLKFNTADNMESGIYFYRLETKEGKVIMNKLILIK